jgi:hypothetical protein
VHTANDHHLSRNCPPAEHCLRARNHLGEPAFWLGPQPVEEALAAATGPKSAAIFAVANHGRWVADCPDCAGAQLTSPDDPRFMCCECGNAAIGGRWRPVTWPKDHAAISALLDERPRHLANAAPGETLKQIRRENKLLSEATLIGVDA